MSPKSDRVDVGGGTGSLLAAILGAHSHVRGVLVDARARSIARRNLPRSRHRRSRHDVAAEFLRSAAPGADLYRLKNVLGDWPAAGALALLTRVAEAARPSGRV